MPNNWNTYKLSKVTTKIGSGSTPRGGQEAYKTSGTSLIRSQNILDFTFSANGLAFIDDAQASKLNNVTLEEDDVLLNITGDSVARVCQVPKELLPARVNQHVAIIRAKKEKLNSSFLKYSLLETSNKNSLLNMASAGATRQAITKSMIEGFEINLPPLQEQQSIASILSAIDDKIENNLAINKTLEEMAMALYKYWFVDFGPFQDGEFVESELGMIPKGWEVKRLDDLINVASKGTTPRMKDVTGLEIKIPFLKVKDVNTDGEINTNNIDLIPEEIHLKDLKRSILYENDLLFSIAGTIGRVSIVTKHLDNSNCNQALAFIRLKDKEKFKSFIYYWLKSDDIQNRIQNSVVQGVQANISLTVLKDLKLPISSDYGIIEKYSDKVNSILELILQNQEENRLLRTQRDTLLPQLISGAVRLKEFWEE
ncbi:MAG: restriction endonuclease subunit S [Flavobacterium sp.]|nr:restriction endonuclease subunit S [Flavobacterium sp.]